MNANDLRAISKKAKSEKSKRFMSQRQADTNEAGDEAYEEFSAYIRSDEFAEQMTKDAQNGYYSTNIKKWEFVPRGDDSYTYGPAKIRLLNVVKYSDLIARLQRLIEELGFKGMTVRYNSNQSNNRKRKPRDSTPPTTFRLFVSWLPTEDREQTDAFDED